MSTIAAAGAADTTAPPNIGSLLELPIQRILREVTGPILIAGCGGGFDIFSGLPLYFALKRAGKTVYLSNYTFSGMSDVRKGRQITPECFEITADTVARYVQTTAELFLA